MMGAQDLTTTRALLTLCFLSSVSSFGSETSVGNETWCYTELNCREDTWPESCSHHQDADGQISPINLKIPSNLSSSDVARGGHIVPESFYFYQFHLEFKGHTLHVIPYMAATAKLKIPEKEYSFHSLHFHWSIVDDAGSEHTIEGRSFPVEMHLVFYESKYETLVGAVADNQNNPTSLVVIAVFLEIEPKEGSRNTSTFLKEIVQALEREDKKGMLLKLNDVIPSTGMYEYSGTSTSPPCNLRCKWYVSRKPVFVPKQHVIKIRQAGISNMSTKENFRSLKPHRQDLNVSFVYFENVDL